MGKYAGVEQLRRAAVVTADPGSGVAADSSTWKGNGAAKLRLARNIEFLRLVTGKKGQRCSLMVEEE